VHFENLYCDPPEYQKILGQFWKKVIKYKELLLDPKELAKLIPEKEDVEQYINIIENKVKIDIYDFLPENELNALKIRYYCIRKKEDTDKAIFGFSQWDLLRIIKWKTMIKCIPLR
jgi:hypothetical protein